MLARELLRMSLEGPCVAFRKWPMKRAKPAALKCDAAVLLGNVRDPDDMVMLMPALDDDEPLVREHA